MNDAKTVRGEINKAMDEMTEAVAEVVMQALRDSMVTLEITRIDAKAMARLTGFCIAMARSQAKLLELIKASNPEYYGDLLQSGILRVSPEETQAMAKYLKEGEKKADGPLG